MTFATRPLSSSGTLGERLRMVRVEARLEIKDVARKTSIAEKYIAAIEESHYNQLPGLVYAQQFVRRYATFLQTDVEAAMEMLKKEYDLVTKARGSKRPLLIARAKTEWPWWRRYSRAILAIFIMAVVLGYLSYQAVKIFMPPNLVITKPSTDISTTAMVSVISGYTDPAAHVTINDQDVQLKADGTFNESVDLHVGLNTLKISSTKKHSGPRTVTRQILVETQK